MPIPGQRLILTIRRVIHAAAAAIALHGPAAAQPVTEYIGQSPNGQPYLYPFQVNERALAGAPALSDLNTPIDAGAALHARPAGFFTIGADGQPGTPDDQRVRLYGINLSFSTNFPDPANAQRIARQLRDLGFNAVRLHHLDTLAGDPADPPLSILTAGPYPTFNDMAVARLRHFIEVLAREGIYTNLNLRVGYRFRPDADGVPAFDPTSLTRAVGAAMYVYDETMMLRQETYAREIIRKLGLANNPALAMVEISNEASLLHAWNTPAEWRDAVPPLYAGELESLWNAWLARRYGSIRQACDTWQTCSRQERSEGKVNLLHPADADMPASALADISRKVRSRVNDLSARLTAPANPFDVPSVQGSQRQVQDFLLFLAETDRRYFDRIARVVREQAGQRVPVTGTQLGYGGILNLTSHAGMDYIDEHFYVDHPHFPSGMANFRDWRIWNQALSNSQMPRLVRAALLRDSNKPFIISEYNHPYPSWQAAEILPLMATIGALQDWDGLFFFDYGNIFNPESSPTSFALRGDWGKYALAAQSAGLFRTGTIAPLRQTRFLPIPTALQLDIAASKAPEAIYRQLMEAGGIGPDALWTFRIGIDPSPGASLPPAASPGSTPPQPSVLMRDHSQDVLVLSAPQARGIFGTIEGKRYDSSALQLDFGASGKRPFSLLLTSLDDTDITASRRLLLTLGSSAVGSEPGSHPPRPKQWIPHPAGSGSWTLAPDPGYTQYPSASRRSTGPAWLLAIPVQASWPTDARAVRAYPLDGEGRRRAALPPAQARIEQGVLRIQLQDNQEQASPWYEIELNP